MNGGGAKRREASFTSPVKEANVGIVKVEAAV